MTLILLWFAGVGAVTLAVLIANEYRRSARAAADDAKVWAEKAKSTAEEIQAIRSYLIGYTETEKVETLETSEIAGEMLDGIDEIQEADETTTTSSGGDPQK